MGVHEGRGQLERGMKDLLARWMETRAAWRDRVAEEFEEQFIVSLQRDAREATGAMDAVAQVLSQVHRDCR